MKRAPTKDPIADDVALVKRAQSGDNSAFGELVEKYRRRVLKVSLRYTHHADDAEDAAQDAFIKAHRGICQFRGESTFYSWLCRIAINSAKTVRSHRAREAAVFESMPPWSHGADGVVAFLRDWATPEAILATDDVCVSISGTLELLCEEQRVAILLREWHELTYEDVATAMACPVGTVRSRVFRAREMIDKRLRRSSGEGLGRAKERAA